MKRTPLFLAVLTACGAVPEANEQNRDEPLPPGAKFEFLKDPINEIYEAKGGKVYLGLGDHARRFEINPEASPDAEEMIAFAKRAKRLGAPVYATILLRTGVAKRKDRRFLRTGVYPLVVRLAAGPDPRARE